MEGSMICFHWERDRNSGLDFSPPLHLLTPWTHLLANQKWGYNNNLSVAKVWATGNQNMARIVTLFLRVTMNAKIVVLNC